MWGAQPRCKLLSLRRVQMPSGTSDWFKSTVHPYVRQVNMRQFHISLWRHSRKRDKGRAVWYSGTKRVRENCRFHLQGKKGHGSGMTKGAVGTWPFSKCNYLPFKLIFVLKMGVAIPPTRWYLSTKLHGVTSRKTVGQSLNPKRQTQCWANSVKLMPSQYTVCL